MRRSATHTYSFIGHLQCSSSIQLVESNAQLGRSYTMDAIHDVFSCIFGTKRHCLYQPWPAHSEQSYAEAPVHKSAFVEMIRFISIGTTKSNWTQEKHQFNVVHTEYRSVLPQLPQSVRDLRASPRGGKWTGYSSGRRYCK